MDKSILKRIAVGAAGLFILIAVFSYSVALFGKENYSLQINFPRDSMLEQEFYKYIIPMEEQEEEARHLNPETVKILKMREYTVKKGQTISEIAGSFGLNVDTIISYNNIKSVRKIYPGMKIFVPNADGIKYRVRQGDCLSCIANKYNIALNDLLDWNNISSSVINPGEILFLPGLKMNNYELRKVLGTLFIYPTKGALSSGYGYRIHPISKKRHFHNGIDITNAKGTKIVAAMDGKVIKVGYSHIYGKYVIIKHDNGFQTLYGHFNKITVEQGTNVLQGNKIGEMGNTGYSTGNHLHFSIYKNGETVNPFTYLK